MELLGGRRLQEGTVSAKALRQVHGLCNHRTKPVAEPNEQ